VPRNILRIDYIILHCALCHYASKV